LKPGSMVKQEGTMIAQYLRGLIRTGGADILVRRRRAGGNACPTTGSDADLAEAARTHSCSRPSLTWFLRRGLVVLLLVMPGFAITQASQGAAEVRLSTSAGASGRFVELSEIARIKTDDPVLEARLAAVQIAPCPELETEMTLTLGQVSDAIMSAGVSLARVNLAGPLEMKVRGCLACKPTPAGEAESVLADAERAIVSAAGIAAGDVAIAWERLPEDLMQLERAGYRARIAEIDPIRTSGPVRVKVKFYDGKRLVTSRTLLASVKLHRTVVVARRSIARGSILDTDDLMLRRQAMTRGIDGAFRDVVRVAGSKARSTIAAGAVISQRMVEPVPLVCRGDVVTLVTRGHGFELSTHGTAAEDGVKGQRIKVERHSFVPGRDRRPKKIPLFGVVVGPGTVLLGNPGES